MTNYSRIGIDINPSGIVIAERDPIAQKINLSITEQGNTPILSDAPVSIGIPGKEMIIKPLRMKPSEGQDITPRLKFELASSLLEPESQFLFEIMPTTKDENYLGLVFRRDRLNELRNLFLASEDTRDVRYINRSQALAKGYIHFCEPLRDGLVAVVHVSDIEVSFCILFNKKTVSLGHLTVDNYNFADDRAFKRLSLDLKTVINFKLNTLAAEGLSIPLSAFILSGEFSNLILADQLTSCFGIEVTQAKIKSTLNLNTPDPKTGTALIALGLTVN